MLGGVNPNAPTMLRPTARAGVVGVKRGRAGFLFFGLRTDVRARALRRLLRSGAQEDLQIYSARCGHEGIRAYRRSPGFLAFYRFLTQVSAQKDITRVSLPMQRALGRQRRSAQHPGAEARWKGWWSAERRAA